eukprot:7181569-Prymnesium_polylepis.1
MIAERPPHRNDQNETKEKSEKSIDIALRSPLRLDFYQQSVSCLCVQLGATWSHLEVRKAVCP